MAKKLEIERKFLVKFPKSWIELSQLMDNVVDVKRISQQYLLPKGEEPAARVRKTVQGLTGDTDVVYHYNKKKTVEKGVLEETEHEISKSEYERRIKEADPKKVEINKTRFVFKYENQIFELDLFKDALAGLAILEIELKDKSDKVDLPPFLKIFKEVSHDKRFNNFSLADKSLHKKIKQLNGLNR